MRPRQVTTPLTSEVTSRLSAGDQVEISGTLYTARDVAHRRMVEALESREETPIDLEGQIIYYVGPAPARPGMVMGSAGPTTSGRMDRYTPQLLAAGVKGMIGKGYRNREVKDAIVSYGAAYFAAVGGSGALLARCIRSAELVAYEDLGPEAIYRLEVKAFPAIVVNDSHGGDLYEQAPLQFRE